jgi:hypothetical protein
MSKFFGLPNEVLSLIFQFDNTYKEIFSKEVLTKIWGESLKRSIRLYSLKEPMYWNFCNNDDEENGDFDEPKKAITQSEIEIGECAVKFAANYLNANMGFYADHVKGENDALFGIGDDFEPYEFSATCSKHSHYLFVEGKNVGDEFERIIYYNVSTQFKNRYKTYQSVFVYNDIDIEKVNSITDNDTLIQKYYDPISRTAIIIDIFPDIFENLIIEEHL